MKKWVSPAGFQRPYKLELDEPLECEWKTYCLWPAHLEPFSTCAHVFPNHSSCIEFPANVQILLPHCTAYLMLYSLDLIYLYCAYFSQCSDVNLIQILSKAKTAAKTSFNKNKYQKSMERWVMCYMLGIDLSSFPQCTFSLLLHFFRLVSAIT